MLRSSRQLSLLLRKHMTKQFCSYGVIAVMSFMMFACKKTPTFGPLEARSRVLGSVEALGTYKDLSHGDWEITVLASQSGSDTTFWLRRLDNDRIMPTQVVVSISEGGAFQVQGVAKAITSKSTASSLIMALTSAFDRDKGLPEHEFTCILYNYPDGAEIGVRTAYRGPGGLIVYRIKEGEISVVSTGL